jgi:hypothetical protein
MKFTSILTSLILENSRFKVIYDQIVQQKGKKESGKIPFETLKAIIFADPTTRIPQGLGDIDTISVEDMENVKVGKYSNWLLKNFIKPTFPNVDAESGDYKRMLKNFQELFLEDLYKTTEDLKKYERFKGQLPQESRDIAKLTPDTLFELVKDFSLEKTKGSKQEKEEAKSSYQYPGSDVVFKGPKWTVVKIEDKGELGKDAACFFGGYHEHDKGESRWCTSSPGLSYFDGYIKQGPLYVVLPNQAEKVGQKTGLPFERYQFHFPSNQFMDRDDRQQDLVQLLMGKLSETKEFFKPEFAKGLTSQNGTKVEISYPDSSAGKFVALYGFDELFDNLPDNIEHLLIQNKGKENIALDVPESIGRFQNLEAILFKNLVKTIPDSICRCTKLNLLSLPDNPSLQSVPECIKDLENLAFINLSGGNSNIHIPEQLRNNLEDQGDGFYYVKD